MSRSMRLFGIAERLFQGLVGSGQTFMDGSGVGNFIVIDSIKACPDGLNLQHTVLHSFAINVG